jgi:hypothetical protein
MPEDDAERVAALKRWLLTLEVYPKSAIDR